MDLYEGWKWREEYRIEEKRKELELTHDLELRRLSLLAHWLNAPHMGKKNPKPTHYYDPDKKEKPKKKTTQEESQRVLDELAEEMGVDT